MRFSSLSVMLLAGGFACASDEKAEPESPGAERAAEGEANESAEAERRAEGEDVEDAGDGAGADRGDKDEQADRGAEGEETFRAYLCGDETISVYDGPAEVAPDAEMIERLPEGTEVELRARMADWYRLEIAKDREFGMAIGHSGPNLPEGKEDFAGRNAYAAQDDVCFHSPAFAPPPDAHLCDPDGERDDLRVRSGPSSDAEAIDALPQNTSVQILAEEGEWFAALLSADEVPDRADERVTRRVVYVPQGKVASEYRPCDEMQGAGDE